MSDMDFSLGWAFYKTNDARQLPADDVDFCEWIQGFCAAQIEYDVGGEYATIESALRDFGVDGDLLSRVLDAADDVLKRNDWIRWPSVPTRV